MLHTDYEVLGVLLIVFFYQFRLDKRLRLVSCGLLLLLGGSLEAAGILAFLPLAFYNGTRGRQNRFFFYWFYPLHLLALWAVGCWLVPLLAP